MPGLADLATPAVSGGAYWYHKKFKVTGPLPGQAVLKVYRAMFGTQVTLNGRVIGDHMFNYLSDALDLTQAQQDQAKAITEKEKATIQPLMKQLMQAHKDLSALEDSGTFDEGKVRALAAQNTPILTELFVQKARIHAELMQILTPEQKTKLAQLKAKHESHMSEHMQNHEQQ